MNMRSNTGRVLCAIFLWIAVAGASRDLRHRSRHLQAVTFTAQNALNASVLVTRPTSVGGACNVQIQSASYSATATAPMTVNVPMGTTSAFTFSTGNSSLLLSLDNSTYSNPALQNNGFLNITLDSQYGLGLTNAVVTTSKASVGDSVTLINDIYIIVPGSSPLKVDPTVQCAINVTFAVVSASQGSTSITSVSGSSSASQGSASTTFINGSSSGSGISVTTNNAGGSSTGSGITGQNNAGTGNVGNCNAGNNNQGDNNIGNGNKGSCNIGNENIGNGWIGNGNKSGGNGPNYPCTCTLQAKSSSG